MKISKQRMSEKGVQREARKEERENEGERRVLSAVNPFSLAITYTQLKCPIKNSYHCIL